MSSIWIWYSLGQMAFFEVHSGYSEIAGTEVLPHCNWVSLLPNQKSNMRKDT